MDPHVCNELKHNNNIPCSTGTYICSSSTVLLDPIFGHLRRLNYNRLIRMHSLSEVEDEAEAEAEEERNHQLLLSLSLSLSESCRISKAKYLVILCVKDYCS